MGNIERANVHGTLSERSVNIPGRSISQLQNRFGKHGKMWLPLWKTPGVLVTHAYKRGVRLFVSNLLYLQVLGFIKVNIAGCL
jgi:hypothetical protein